MPSPKEAPFSPKAPFKTEFGPAGLIGSMVLAEQVLARKDGCEPSELA